MAAIARAESEMFEGLVAWRGDLAEKPKLTVEAEARLRHSIKLYQDAQNEVGKYVGQFYGQQKDGSYPSDRGDYTKWSDAAQRRIDGVQAFLAAPDEASRKTDFLDVETIER
jgi:hypothetical protein